jgi:hypothetical protein
VAGEDGRDLFVGGEAARAGIGEAAIDAGQFSLGGVIDTGCKASLDFLGIGGQFRLGLGWPGGGASEGVGEGTVDHGDKLARCAAG